MQPELILYYYIIIVYFYGILTLLLDYDLPKMVIHDIYQVGQSCRYQGGDIFGGSPFSLSHASTSRLPDCRDGVPHALSVEGQLDISPPPPQSSSFPHPPVPLQQSPLLPPDHGLNRSISAPCCCAIHPELSGRRPCVAAGLVPRSSIFRFRCW